MEIYIHSGGTKTLKRDTYEINIFKYLYKTKHWVLYIFKSHNVTSCIYNSYFMENKQKYSEKLVESAG